MIVRDRGGIVQTAKRVAAGELDPAKLPKRTQQRVAEIRAQLGDTLSAPPMRRLMSVQHAKVRRARTS